MLEILEYAQLSLEQKYIPKSLEQSGKRASLPLRTSVQTNYHLLEWHCYQELIKLSTRFSCFWMAG